MPSNVEIVHAVNDAFVRGDIPALIDFLDANEEIYPRGSFNPAVCRCMEGQERRCGVFQNSW